MGAPRTASFILAILLSSSIAGVSCLSNRTACKSATAFGTIEGGQRCPQAGLVCNPKNPACTGFFNNKTRTCTDTYLPCTCNATSGTNKTWSCPVQNFMCIKPEDRCSCNNPALVGFGKVCYKKGLKCAPKKPSCTGIFNSHTNTCTDSFLPCTCKKESGHNKTWSCPKVFCPKQDDRCTCNNRKLVGPGKVCYKEGLSCKRATPSCTGIFNEKTKTCTDAYLPCTCDTVRGNNKTWSCPMASCVKPDDRCTCANPKLIGSGKTCYKKGLVCPNKPGKVTCTGIYDSSTKHCKNITLVPDCTCESGSWVCAVADCPKPDSRCT